MIRIGLAGITGWIGKPLAEAIRSSEDLELAIGVARSLGNSVEEALKTPFDVLVDYTSATAVKANVIAAVDAARHVVVGSSGLSDADYAEIDALAHERGVGVIAVGNFAISAALLQRFAAEAAKLMPSWEIIDYAHDGKIDAPSGTARELAWRLSQVGTPKTAVPLDEVVGPRESRGATVSGSLVHSVRLPGHTIAIEVLFGREDERLTLRYEGGVGAQPYISGTLLAIRRVQEFRGVVRGMEKLL